MLEFSRTERLIGKDELSNVQNANIIIFGLGGVGSYVAEALARCGVGKMTVVDKDTVDITNINRQLIALHGTVGQYKTEVCAKRICDINPDCRVKLYTMFYSEENAAEIDLSEYDYIVDAIDSVPSKLFLASESVRLNIPIISMLFMFLNVLAVPTACRNSRTRDGTCTTAVTQATATAVTMLEPSLLGPQGTPPCF